MRRDGENVAVVICAAGLSGRMGGKKKEFAILPASSGKCPISVLGAAARAFAMCPRIVRIAITLSPNDKNAETIARSGLPEELLKGTWQDRLIFTEGGPTRRASVHNGLLAVSAGNPDIVLIHDGARPWIKPPLIERVIDAAIRYGAVIPALPLVETPKEYSGFSLSHGNADEAAFIKRHLRRAELCTAQTPQGFRFPEILAAHEKAALREEQEHYEYTDDAEVWGEFIGQVAVIPGDGENRKITFPEDLTTNGEGQNGEYKIRDAE